MEEFENWKEKFYAEHRGVYRFTPTCEMGWTAALKWIKDAGVLEPGLANDLIDKELEE